MPNDIILLVSHWLLNGSILNILDVTTDTSILLAETTMAPNDDTTTTKSDGIQFPEGVTVEPFNPFAGAKKIFSKNFDNLGSETKIFTVNMQG